MGGIIAAKHKVIFAAKPQDVFEVLTDFESYPEFIPEVSYARIVEETDAYTVIDFRINLGRSFSYTLKFTTKPYQWVRWTYVRGDFRSNEGSWTLEPKGPHTEATYRLALDLGRLVPKFVMTALAGFGLSSLLSKYKKRVESGDAKKPIHLPDKVADYEKHLIRSALRRTQHDHARTAELLCVTPTHLKKRMKALEIEPG